MSVNIMFTQILTSLCSRLSCWDCLEFFFHIEVKPLPAMGFSCSVSGEDSTRCHPLGNPPR